MPPSRLKNLVQGFFAVSSAPPFPRISYLAFGLPTNRFSSKELNAPLNGPHGVSETGACDACRSKSAVVDMVEVFLLFIGPCKNPYSSS